ncbi:MAG: hypothetical protein IPP35_09660 [Elusimicrobia bacterium]|nr:hypothetical protein [Elusimicrobiota bacterium]
MSIYVENLRPLFLGDTGFTQWLIHTWLPEEKTHGLMTQEMVQRVWPEFDWESAFAFFTDRYRPLCDTAMLRRSPGLEALARCVTETETAMIYRAIGVQTKSEELKKLMFRMSSDEIRHYKYFREIFHKYDSRERHSLWRKFQTIADRTKLVRDEDMNVAFSPLNHYWKKRMPFRALCFKEFCLGASSVAQHYIPFGTAKQMLLNPLEMGSWSRAPVFDLLFSSFCRYLLRCIGGPARGAHPVLLPGPV